MVTSGAADSHVTTAEFLQVADREVEDFEGGLPGGNMIWQAPDISTARQRALAYGAGPETRLSW
jgi:hypothetical protein